MAETRSFTRASERLHIVQSAASASIRTLELDLQAELFTRTTQRVALTEAGALLLPEARRILAEVQSARELAADVSGGLRGTLTIGTMQALSAGPLDIPRLLVRFRESHPLLDVRLRYAANGSTELAEDLRTGRIDIAILSLPDRRHPGISLTSLASEPMLLMCAPDHRLATRRSVRAGVDRARRRRCPAHPVRGRRLNWEISLAVPSNRPLTAAARAFAGSTA